MQNPSLMALSVHAGTCHQIRQSLESAPGFGESDKAVRT
jgi:hypothetical protein